MIDDELAKKLGWSDELLNAVREADALGALSEVPPGVDVGSIPSDCSRMDVRYSRSFSVKGTRPVARDTRVARRR